MLAPDIPDELYERDITNANLLHLKQRLVRLEKSRAELAARLIAERRRYNMDVTSLKHHLDGSEMEAALLRQEVDRLRTIMGLPQHLALPFAGIGSARPSFES